MERRFITIPFVLIFVLCVNTSELSNNNQQKKFGCKWIRISNENEDNDRILSCKLHTISGLDNLLINLTSLAKVNSNFNNNHNNNYNNQIVNSLNLECNEKLFVESSLDMTNFEDYEDENDFISDKSNIYNKYLQEFTIRYCKIKYVPSKAFKTFKNIKSISLHTHNGDWSTINLEFNSDSFMGLNELRELNLAHNNIWNLPSDIFCPLNSLKQLNLSNNHINDISQVGFTMSSVNPTAEIKQYNLKGSSTKSCNGALELLDLSYNNLMNIPNSCFSSLKSIIILRLDSNQISMLDDNSFEGLNSVQLVNLTNNRLLAIPPELFNSTKELRQLYVGHNTLAVLAPGLFENLKHLEVLDLSYNELTSDWINRDTFIGLIRLVVLNLNNNKLSKIDKLVFRELYNLQSLNLESNAIEVIAPNAFSDLKNLHELLLSHNQLKVIESNHFADLFVLNQLILESNRIEVIHQNAFDNLTNLNDLSLTDNRLEKIPEPIKKLRYIKLLDLGKNKISVIDNNSFEGLEELVGLRLTDNQITSITKNAFAPLKALHVLNLSTNKIKHIDQSAFISNPALRAIRLDSNLLEDISTAFTSLPGLVLLNVSDNNIKWFDYSHLPQSLEWLDIHKNNITELRNHYEVTNELRINWLDVSQNKIKVINKDLIPRHVEEINLSSNMIDEIPSGTFLNKKNIKKISLNGNLIKKLQITSLLLSKVNITREMPEIYLADNPLHCDCSMEWLRNINDLSEQRRQLPKIKDLEGVKCSLELNREQNNEVLIRPLSELASGDFLCKYRNHCFTLCECCEGNNDLENSANSDCQCQMTCPDQCSCYHDSTWNKNIVDCGDVDFETIPKNIPMDVSVLYLDGNNIQNISYSHFVGRNRLEVLYLNDSNIENIASNAFDDMKNLRILYLNNNNINRLSGNEFSNQLLLGELYLDHNQISNIAENTFVHMKHLKTIDLSNNRMIDFNPIKQLASASNAGVLSNVYLDGDNKWNCDCKSLIQLVNWIKYRSNNFNVNRMLCMDNRIVGDVLNNCQLTINFNYNANKNGNSENVTPSQSIPVQQQHFNVIYDSNHHNPLTGNGGYIPLFAAVLVTIITVALLIALVCIFRQDVKLWAFTKYGIRLFNCNSSKKKNSAHRCNHPNDHMTGDECYDEKLYDSYFIYSMHDAELLTQIIVPELQNIGYSVSLYNHHHKPMISHDNFHTASYLIDTFKSGSDISHKTILVISLNFLQNEWNDHNFRCALQSIIDTVNRKNNNIILVLTVPVQLIQMDPILQLLLRTCTVICWGEKRFWSKLRYALPDVANNKDLVGKYVDNVNNSFGNIRYTTAPTATMQTARNNTLPYNNNSGWYNLSPVLCNGYSMPMNYQQQQQQSQRLPHHPQQYYCNENEMTPRRMLAQQQTPYEYSQPDYHGGPMDQQLFGGSLNNVDNSHVYSTIPETPPLSTCSITSSTPSLHNDPLQPSNVNTHLLDQQQKITK